MLIAQIKDELWSQEQPCEHRPYSKFEQAILEAGVRSKALHCRLHEGHLSIHGTVNNYRQKQMAQEAVRPLPGVLEITNHLQIGHMPANETDRSQS